MGSRIRGILFDLGDTLLDFCRVRPLRLFEDGARQVYEYLRRLDLPLPSFERYHRRQLWAVRWSYLKSRLSGREFNSLDLMTRLSRRLGHRLTARQMLEVAWLWYEPLRRRATVEEGLPRMLSDLRAAGLALGLISNTFVPSQVLDRHLAEEGLLEHLPVRVYSCDVGYRKPDCRIFEAALSRAGLAAAETLFVGDSPKADIGGARRTGMISVLKDPLGRHADGRCSPRHRIRSLLELPGILTGYRLGGP